MQDWNPQKVVYELHRNGTSLRKLSIQNGYKTPTALTSALRKPYLKCERIIASALDVPPEQIWPLRYEKRRQRIRDIYGQQLDMA